MPPTRGRPRKRKISAVAGISDTRQIPERMTMKELRDELSANEGSYPSWAKKKALIHLVKRGHTRRNTTSFHLVSDQDIVGSSRTTPTMTQHGEGEGRRTQ